MKKAAVFLLTVVVLLANVSGCGSEKKQATTSSPKAESGVIKIGVFQPLTGRLGEPGRWTLDGIKLANEMKPKVLGRDVELVVMDNKSDKAEAARVVAQMIDKDKVNAIIGTCSSSLSIAAWEKIKSSKTPAVACSSTNPWVTKSNDYYFRACFIDPFQGEVMAKYVINDLGAKTVAIIWDDQQDYSVGLSKFFIEAFEKIQGNSSGIIIKEPYETDATDFSELLERVKKANPDAIFAPGVHTNSARLIKQAREMGITAPFLGGDTWEAQEFIDMGGAAVEGATFSTHFSPDAPPATPETEIFLKAYEEKYNRKADAFGALGFDAYMLILNAIEKAGSAEPESIKNALKVTKGFEGSTGVITFDANGDPKKDAVIYKVENGKFVYVTTVKP